MTDKNRLAGLINRKQDYGVTYTKSQMDDRKVYTNETPNSVVADYLLANGVIVPPCKIGDKIYTYGARRVKEWVITFCGKNSRGEYKMIAADDGFKNVLEFWDYDIGKTVFLAKEEAEAGLKEKSNRTIV